MTPERRGRAEGAKVMQGRRPQPRRAGSGSCKGSGQILSSQAPLKWDEWVILHVTALRILPPWNLEQRTVGVKAYEGSRKPWAQALRDVKGRTFSFFMKKERDFNSITDNNKKKSNIDFIPVSPSLCPFLLNGLLLPRPHLQTHHLNTLTTLHVANAPFAFPFFSSPFLPFTPTPTPSPPPPPPTVQTPALPHPPPASHRTPLSPASPSRRSVGDVGSGLRPKHTLVLA